MATFVIRGPEVDNFNPNAKHYCIVCLMLQKAYFYKQDDGFKDRLQNINDRPSDGEIHAEKREWVKDIPHEFAIAFAPSVLGFPADVCWTHIAGHDPEKMKEAQEEAVKQARMRALNPNSQGIMPN